MQSTTAEQDFLKDRGPRLRALGPPGSGKTTLLRERWRQRAVEEGPDRLLVVCRSRSAADRFLDSVVAHLDGATNALPVTTWSGFALDLLRRHGPGHHLLTGAERWAVVRRLLADDQLGDWPACAEYVGRAAFVAEVTRALAALFRAAIDPEELLAAARTSGDGGRWADLVSFSRRYQRHLAGRAVIDVDALIRDAAAALEEPQIQSVEAARWAEVMIDDAEAMTPAMSVLLARLDPPRITAAASPAVALGPLGDWSADWVLSQGWDRTIELDASFRTPAAGQLVQCHHPATEAEAVAGVLLDARAAGVDWHDMAVLVRRDHGRARRLSRALARHGIPTLPVLGSPGEEPAVRAIADFLAWTMGEEDALARLLGSVAMDVERRDATPDPKLHPKLAELEVLRGQLVARLEHSTPGDLIFDAWCGLFRELVPDPDDGPADPATARALDAVTAFVSSAMRRSATNPAWTLADELALLDGPDWDVDGWWPTAPTISTTPTAVASADAVTISPIAAAAGREWHTVVIAGCLEGELPRLAASVPFFDPAVLALARQSHRHSQPPGPLPTVAERRLASLADERRLFLMATTRASASLIATAAPRPGQLVSRFVSRWVPRAQPVPIPVVARDAIPAAPVLPTGGVVPVHPDGQLVLSASQLTMYDDCPLRYAYRYALGVESRGGVAAEIGSIVHEALAEFLDPAGPEDRSWDRLERLADAHWSDEVAPYRPVREQARRDIYTMLRDWWEAGVPQDVVAVECPFDIPVGAHRVRGYIDRVDRVTDGIAIVDYKTGSRVPPADEVDRNIQLAVYHLAAERLPELQALGPPVSLQLLHVRSGRVSQQVVTDDHGRRTERGILDAATHILAESFEPSPEADCEYCDFRRLCPLQPEGREVGTA